MEWPVKHVPREHLLRGVACFLDLRDRRQHPAPFYSPMGWPSIDPGLMIHVLIVGYCFGVRLTHLFIRRHAGIFLAETASVAPGPMPDAVDVA
jgi:hypothetical protein